MKKAFASGTKKAVFFDLNGTLYDPDRTYLHSLGEVLGDFTGRWAADAGGPPAPGGAQPHGAALAAFAAAWRTAPAAADGARAREARRLDCLAQALAGLPLAGDRARIAALDRRVRERGRSRPQATPGARETLEALAPRYRLAVLSNGSRAAALRRIRQLGLERWLPDARVFASRVPARRKPKPHLFRQALKDCRVTAAEAVMIGDAWRTDMVGAARCGIDGIWLAPRQSRKGLRYFIEGRRVRTIRKLEDLLQLL